MKQHTFYASIAWLPLLIIVSLWMSCLALMLRAATIMSTLPVGLPIVAWGLGISVVSVVLIVALYVGVTYCLVNYKLDRTTLAIRWGLLTYRIPLDGMKVVKRIPTGNWRARIGLFPTKEDNVLFLTTSHAKNNLIHLRYGDQSFVISPRRSTDFLSTIYRIFKVRQLSQELYSDTPAPQPINSSYPAQDTLRLLAKDKLVVGFVLLSGALVLGAVLYLAGHYAKLPDQVMVYYTLDNSEYAFSSPRWLMVYPLLAALLGSLSFVGAGAIARRERMASYLLLAGGVTAEVITLVPLITAIRLHF
jgi:hypothetical protein